MLDTRSSNWHHDTHYNDTHQNDILYYYIRLIIVNATLSATAYLGCAECHNGKCIYALCPFAECHGTLSLAQVLIKKIMNIFCRSVMGLRVFFKMVHFTTKHQKWLAWMWPHLELKAQFRFSSYSQNNKLNRDTQLNIFTIIEFCSAKTVVFLPWCLRHTVLLV
jgi:hypothetical protein